MIKSKQPHSAWPRTCPHSDRGSYEMKRFLAFTLLIVGSGLALVPPAQAFGQEVVVVTHHRHHRRHHHHPVVVVARP